MEKQKVHYEPHPVSPERKAELRAQGYRIVDVAFAPADYVRADAEPEQAARRGRRSNSESAA
ncbi:hypothetical protein [Luteibacter yeojuensis]|nr:hypothetical protein [Luteibacter yeojuensis]